jgi:uncharacterized protein (TIGR00255 family)
MTGFGRGEASDNDIAVTAELRSVNSRYLDISFYIPQEIQEKEVALKKQIQKKINRGKVNLSIRIDRAHIGQPDITVNPELAKGYKELLDELRHKAQLTEPIVLQDLMQFEEIFVSRGKDEKTVQTIWDNSQKALDEALDQLIAMRAQEGQHLQEDLNERAGYIAAEMEKVRKLSEGRADEARDALLKRIGKLVDDETLDEERLEMEVAVLVDKMDVTEELVRLQSHIKFFKEALENDETVGRRLKFLTQEINREINTIGAKANSSEISQHVVGAKESLEQIREQIANVE